MAINWITAFKLIPWRDVVENAPTVLNAAKKLWDKRGTPPPPPPQSQAPAEPQADPRLETLERELAALKHEAEYSAHVIKTLAEQNNRLVEAIEVLRVRTRVLLYSVLVLGVWAVALAVVLAIR